MLPSEPPPAEPSPSSQPEFAGQPPGPLVERHDALVPHERRPVHPTGPLHFGLGVLRAQVPESRNQPLSRFRVVHPDVHVGGRLGRDDVGARPAPDQPHVHGNAPLRRRERGGGAHDAREFGDRVDAALGVETRMGGASPNRHPEDPDAAPAGLGAAAGQRRLHHEAGSRPRGFRFDELPARRASRLFIGVPEDGERPARPDSLPVQKPERRDGLHEARLHVIDTRTPGHPILDPERDFRQRSVGPDGVQVTEQEQRSGPAPAPESEPADAVHATFRDSSR